MPKRIRLPKHCSRCGVDVSNGSWARHCRSKKHRGIKRTYECSTCDYVATGARNLYSHRRWVHRNIDKKVWLYGCVVCEIRLRDTEHARAHLKSKNHLRKFVLSNISEREVIIRDKMVVYN